MELSFKGIVSNLIRQHITYLVRKTSHRVFSFNFPHFLPGNSDLLGWQQIQADNSFRISRTSLSFKCFGRFSLIAIRENKLMTWYGSMCYYRQDTIFKLGTSWYKIKGLKLILVMNTKRLINIFACSLTEIKISFEWIFPSLFWLPHTHFLPCSYLSNESCSTNRMHLIYTNYSYDYS